VEQLDPSDWARVVAVNLTGAFHTAKAAIPQLREVGGGSLVLISSTAGLGAGPGYAAYYSSKHGVIGLMRTLANELAGDGIRVNAVCPGWVDTGMVDSQAADAGLTREEAAKLFTGDHLIQRLIRPDEISDAVLWLASPHAAMVTGVALPVDGGHLARVFSA
jgi:NAD(P)-dependent dehydrogenase (short-subunit alcohol dehydrogenase family)